MCLAHPRCAEEHHILRAIEEAQALEALDLLALDGGLEGEVEVVEGLDGRQTGRSHGCLQLPLQLQVASPTLLSVYGLRSFCRSESTLLLDEVWLPVRQAPAGAV